MVARQPQDPAPQLVGYKGLDKDKLALGNNNKYLQQPTTNLLYPYKGHGTNRHLATHEYLFHENGASHLCHAKVEPSPV